MSGAWLGLILTALCAGRAAAMPAAQRPAPAERRIQIGILPKAPELSFSCEGRCSVADAEGEVQALFPGKSYLIGPGARGLKLGTLDLAAEVRIEPAEADGAVVIGSRRYPGLLILRLNGDGTVAVIDELGIEQYLLGVLPHEMDPGWPLEALKAQAVVARTFAYTQLGKYRKAGFDLTSDTRSQVFGGLGEVAEPVRRAVAGTRGEVLGYKGAILSVYYHSCCGGHTSDAAVVWGAPKSPPPLRGVKDRYCLSSPHARWSVFLGAAEILSAVRERHLITGGLRRFSIGRRDAAGFARDFIVAIGAQELEVRANDFRLWLGGTLLKSTRIRKILRRPGGFEVVGGGSGHGVGLCQWGARLQAEKGRGYESILQFYFPGSTLSVVDE